MNRLHVFITHYTFAVIIMSFILNMLFAIKIPYKNCNILNYILFFFSSFQQPKIKIHQIFYFIFSFHFLNEVCFFFFHIKIIFILFWVMLLILRNIIPYNDPSPLLFSSFFLSFFLWLLLLVWGWCWVSCCVSFFLLHVGSFESTINRNEHRIKERKQFHTFFFCILYFSINVLCFWIWWFCIWNNNFLLKFAIVLNEFIITLVHFHCLSLKFIL